MNLCPEVFPANSMMTLKMGLLLSLASCSPNIVRMIKRKKSIVLMGNTFQAQKLPVLVASDDPIAISRLFRISLSLLGRSVLHTASSLTHLVSGRSSILGIPAVEAGSVPLSGSGVCCLDVIGT